MKLKISYAELLKQSFLFKNLPDEQQTAEFEKLNIQSFHKGETIYSQHHFERSLGIVLEGEAAVYKDSNTLLNTLKPGNCFGAAAIFVPTEEYVTQIVADRLTTVVFITDGELRSLFRQYPEMAMDYIAFLSGRIQFLNKKIDSFTTASAEDAVWQYLESHADENGCLQVEGGFARLARELNIGRASLYRCLSRLEKQEKVKKDGARIQICRH